MVPKDAHILIILDYLVGPRYLQWSVLVGGRNVRERFEDTTWLAMNTEKGAMPQGIETASRSQKRLGNEFTPRAPKRSVSLLKP